MQTGRQRGSKGLPGGIEKGAKTVTKNRVFFNWKKVFQKGSRKGAKSMKKKSKMRAGTRVLKNRESGGVPYKDPK